MIYNSIESNRDRSGLVVALFLSALGRTERLLRDDGAAGRPLGRQAHEARSSLLGALLYGFTVSM